MFGFGKGKLRKELEELERTAEADRENLARRLRRADLTVELHRGPAALPLYDAIAADFPDDCRHALTAAQIRFANGDPGPMERMAADHPGMAAGLYYHLVKYYASVGDEEARQRVAALFGEAHRRQEAAEAEGRLLDPGGPLEAPDFDPDVRASIAKRLAKVRGLDWVLAGKRRLDTGHRQEVVLFESGPRGDPREAYAVVTDIFQTIGDNFVWHYEPQWEALREELEQLEGSRLFP